MQPKQFFSESVTPTQWCVFSFGIETTTSASRRSRGTQSSRRPVYRVWRGVRTTGASLRSTKRSFASSSASRKPVATTTASVSRRCPGPSATTTDDAPSRRSAFAAAITTLGSVLTEVSAKNSTRFGFSTTERRRTSVPTRRRPSNSEPLEVGVVSVGPEHGRRRRPRLGKGAAIERGCLVERTQSLRDDSAAGGRPRRRRRPSGRGAVGG